ncbi:FmdB family zinc ribbon protein [Tengunoibacter tsumagoiensis]|uniref:Putative regulatory protein FmdB zinc ribbon domain-containing protein n=1 Tax=Tengunoibacter tsumagoiensis TaxID=2014871 RepID=A0A401ZVD9_9CHLR|nr:hypothetical protein KTT_06150 [Tengunoibacter tsumagoiensis]
MPLYEYYCSDCKSKFELITSHKHADDIVCMKCHSEKVRRMISVFSARRGGENFSFDDAPASGGCGCGNGSCGCH